MKPILRPNVQPAAPDLAGGPHSEPYRPFVLPEDGNEDGMAFMENDRHERILEGALGGAQRYSPFTGYGSSAGPTREEQAYLRALQGGLPDAPEDVKVGL
jgi:hypothetical protein